MAHDLFGNAAEEEMFQAGVSMGGNYDQVASVLFGSLTNFLRGTAVEDLQFHWEPRIQFSFSQEREQVPGALKQSVPFDCEPKMTEFGRQRVGNNMDQENLCAEALGESGSVAER